MKADYIRYVEYISLESFNEMIHKTSIKHYFTDEEIALYSVDKKRRSLAARWIIKKILIKHYKSELNYKDISITNKQNGKPVLKINKTGMKDQIRISLSHTRIRAVGMVIICN